LAILTEEERKERAKGYKKKYRENNRELIRAHQAAYRERHREKIRASHKKWVSDHSERNSVHKHKWYEQNKESINGKAQAYWKARPGEKAAHCAKRRAGKKTATPGWADLNVIKEIYIEAQKQGLTVDHIVPLTSSKVCGLHCEDNLQLLTSIENSSKHNRYWEGM